MTATAREIGSREQTRLWTAIFISGVGVSSIGDYIYLVALNLMVLDRTHSATAIAGLWVILPVARMIVGPWAGSITDRFPLRRQLVGIELLRSVLIALLPLMPSLSLVYLVLFLLGCTSPFFANVFVPYQTLLIPSARRKRTNAIISTLRYSSMLTGPAIAGVFLLRGTVALPFWVDAGTFLVSGLSFLLLPALAAERTVEDARHKRSSRTWHVLRADWRDAVSFLRQHPFYTGLFCLITAQMVFGVAADAQEVVFAQEALHLGKLGYGMMVSAAGVGFVVGSVVISVLTKRMRTHWMLGFGTVLAAVGYLVYASAHSFGWAVAGLVILGIFGSISQVGFATYQQQAVPVAHMGRVNNVLGPPQQMLFILSMLLGGWAVERFGVRHLMISMTLLMGAAGLAVFWLVSLPRNRQRLAGTDDGPGVLQGGLTAAGSSE